MLKRQNSAVLSPELQGTDTSVSSPRPRTTRASFQERQVFKVVTALGPRDGCLASLLLLMKNKRQRNKRTKQTTFLGKHSSRIKTKRNRVGSANHSHQDLAPNDMKVG